MPNPSDPLPGAFTADELARAVGCDRAEVDAWIEAGAIRTLPVAGGVTWISAAEAVRCGQALRAGTMGAGVDLAAHLNDPEWQRVRQAGATSHAFRGPLAVSTSVHLSLIAGLVLLATLNLGSARIATETPLDPDPLRMVYVPLPGPGGGGGGGGLKQIVAPPKATLKGAAHVSSPVPRPDPPPATEKPPDPPKLDPAPPIEAPVAEKAADAQDKAGVLAPSPSTADVRGPGEGGGVGTGKGTGIGEGSGPGIGDGQNGGTGGGPFRPGSGIAPPTLLHEVRPDYTEEARRRGVRGEVDMEIVVRRDGSVSDVKIVRGLGYGLDDRATAAVTQWKFQPATRHGVPVDVIVEVSMEFRLR